MKHTHKILLAVTSVCTVIILGVSIFFVTQGATNNKLENTSQTTQHSSSSSKPVEDKQTTKQLDQAKQLAASYHYDEAIALLEKDDAKEAQQLLATLKKEKESFVTDFSVGVVTNSGCAVKRPIIITLLYINYLLSYYSKKIW